MPAKKLSIRSALLIRMAAVLLIAVGVGGAYTYWQVTREANELGERVIRQTSNLVDQRISSLLKKAEAQAKLLGRIARPQITGEDRPPIDRNRFPIVADQAVELLAVNPEFASVTLTLEDTGESVSAITTSSRPTIIQTSIIENGSKITTTDLPVVDGIIKIESVPDWPSDPRHDEAYQRCKETLQPVWTNVRLVGQRADERSGIPGVVCLVPLQDTNNNFVGTVAIALSLRNLSVFLLDTKVGENGFSFLVELDSKGETRIVADPQPLTAGAENQTSLPDASSITDPVRLAFLDQIENIPVLGTNEVFNFRFKVEDRRYIAGMRLVTDKPGSAWAMCILAPQDDFLATSRQTVLFFVTFGTLAVAVGAAVSLLLARRFAQPLQKLAHETSRIRSLDFDPSPVQPTRIREIDELSESVETMKSGLRSMEKLVPKEYAQHLISSGQEAKLGGERRHITVYFADLVGFTRLSHQLPPEELMLVLAEYLDVLSNEVQMFGGTIDKFNGDDVMAFWGAPTITSDHALMAIKTALSSLESLAFLHTEWREQGKPILNASFGIATGDVIVGNVGNQKRMNYTVIGDSVNLASRLQGLNKFYSTHILIGERAHNEAGDAIICRPVDIVSVFNREKPERIYEPIALAETATPAQKQLARVHNEAFEAYQKRMWTKAAQLFEDILDEYPKDGPAAILHARCQDYEKSPPPENWNGSNELLFK